MAAESIYNSAEKRTKSVESLKTVIVWAFTLFSVGGFAVSLFGKLNEFHTYALISFGIAFFMLTIAYVQAGRAEYPVVNEYNPNEAKDIKKALSNVVAAQSERFKWASGITSIGFFFLAIGLLIQFGAVKKETKEIEKVSSSFDMKVGVERRGDNVFIPMTIMSKKNERVEISIINDTSLVFSADPKKLLFNQAFYTDSIGRLYYSYTMEQDTIKTLLVKATIQQKNEGDVLVEQSKVIRVKIKK
jgi:hypothetical protein